MCVYVCVCHVAKWVGVRGVRLALSGSGDGSQATRFLEMMDSRKVLLTPNIVLLMEALRDFTSSTRSAVEQVHDTSHIPEEKASDMPNFAPCSCRKTNRMMPRRLHKANEITLS